MFSDTVGYLVIHRTQFNYMKIQENNWEKCSKKLYRSLWISQAMSGGF